MLHPRTFWLNRGVFVPPRTGAVPDEVPADDHRPLTIYDVLAWSHPPRQAGPARPHHRVVARRQPAAKRLTLGF